MAITAYIGEGQKLIGITAKISFPYNVNYVKWFQKRPERCWLPDTKQWEIPYKDFLIFEKEVAQEPVTVFDNRPKENPFKGTNLPSIPSSYQFKFIPYKHQEDAIKFGLVNNKFLLSLDPGLGKTLCAMVIAEIKKQQCNYKHCLVICGVGNIKWNWKLEIEKYGHEQAHILGVSYARSAKGIEGNPAARLKDLQKIDELPYFIITNKESLRDEKIAKELKKLCDNKTIGCIIYDEIHKGLNFSTKQGKGIKNLEVETKIALTGTPIVNSPLDAYGVLYWLGKMPQTKTAFLRHYAIMGGFNGWQVVGWKNLEELNQILDKIQVRYLKSQCKDLPPKIYKDEYLWMSTDQYKVYKEMESEITTTYADKVDVPFNPMTALIRLKQATTCPSILSSTIKDNIKFDRAKEIIADVVANGGKVIVFSLYNQVIYSFYESLPKEWNSAIITGVEKNVQTQIFKFKQDESCKIVCCNIKSGGTGLNFPEATDIIFMDLPWTMADKIQSEDRAHRLNTKHSVVIHNLMCKGTIDERCYALIKKKDLYSKNIVDGEFFGNDKKKLLDFLLS